MMPKIYQLLNLAPLPEDLEVGIEVELECNHFPHEVPDWQVKGDGSLRGTACEYVLNLPVSRDKVQTVINRLNTELDNYGTIISDSDRCGVHIHLNMQRETFSHTMAVICMFLLFEDVLLSYCGESREGNFYCLRARDADSIIDTMIQAQITQTAKSLTQEGDRARYAAMNTGALSRFGSIEFRCLKTPQNILEIEEWVDILLRLKDEAKQYKDLRNIVTDFSMNGPEEFMLKIFGRDLSYKIRRNNPPLNEYMYEGVRRIQDIVYSIPVNPPTTLSDLKEGGYREMDINAEPDPIRINVAGNNHRIEEHEYDDFEQFLDDAGEGILD